MGFELTSEFLTQLKSKIAENDLSWIQNNALSLHPADIADIIDKLNLDDAKFIYYQVDEETQADILMELSMLSKLIKSFNIINLSC